MEETKQYPYTIKCIECGREWHYEQFTCYMQKINAFHCNCGGKLIVIDHKAEKAEKTEMIEKTGTAEKEADTL